MKKPPPRPTKIGGEKVAIIAIIAVFSIPLVAILAPFLFGTIALFSSSLHLFIPFLWVGSAVLGIKYLMGVQHKNRLELQEKKIELEKLELSHLQEAEKLIEPPE
ncbi:MAG: hypothetical protein KC646_09815 [Candidatus Cloacimonetes bacterium]|nr:hypothetical protein [Candidatus Cloacimonadota bacterium]